MQVRDPKNTSRTADIVLAVVCFLLQVAFAPNLSVGGGYANFAIIYAGICALTIGGRTGVIAGFISGLVFDLSSTGPIGLMAMLLTVMSYSLGLEERNRMSDGMTDVLSSFGLASLAVVLVYHIAMIFVGQASSIVDVVFVRTIPTFAMTFVAFIPFAYFYTRNVSGPSTLGRRNHGNRLNTRGL